MLIRKKNNMKIIKTECLGTKRYKHVILNDIYICRHVQYSTIFKEKYFFIWLGATIVACNDKPWIFMFTRNLTSNVVTEG